MPRSHFEPKNFTALNEIIVGGGVTPGIVEGNTARIKRVDTTLPNNSAYSRAAPLLPSAEFVTQPVAMAALSEIFGVHAEGYYVNAGGTRIRRPITESVALQISVDGGATFQTYNNGWIAANADGAYTSLPEFNERCDLFQPGTTLLNPRSLAFRIQLTSYTHTDKLTYNPVLTRLVTFVEWDSNPYLDLFGTIKELIEEDFRIPVLRRHAVTAANVAANTIPLQTNYIPDAAQAFSIFNLTQDPNKNINIFQAFDAASSTLSLVAASGVAETDVLEISYGASSPVFVVRPDEMAITTNIPSVVVVVEQASMVGGRHAGRTKDFKRGTTTNLVRLRNVPVYRACNVRVEVYARSAREAITGIQSLERVLGQGFQSIATGETFSLNIINPSVMVDFGDQSYYSGNVEFTVQYFDHSESYEQLVAAKTIVSQYGNFSKTFSTATITENGVVNETL